MNTEFDLPISYRNFNGFRGSTDVSSDWVKRVGVSEYDSTVAEVLRITIPPHSVSRMVTEVLLAGSIVGYGAGSYEVVCQISEGANDFIGVIGPSGSDVGRAVKVASEDAFYTYLKSGWYGIRTAFVFQNPIVLNPNKTYYLWFYPGEVSSERRVSIISDNTNDAYWSEAGVDILGQLLDSPPSVSVSVTAYNSNSTVSGWGIYLQGYSQADISVSAVGTGGTAITNYTVRLGSLQVWSGAQSSGRSAVITGSGSMTITATVTDVTGAITSATTTINVKPYANPNLTNIQCYRCNSSGTAATNGTYLYFSGTPKFSSAGNHNTCTTSFKYGASGGSMSGYTTISNPTTWQRIASGLSTTSTYSVVFKVADALGNYREFSITIPTELVTMNFKDGGTGICFGSYATKDNCFEIANAQGWRAVISNGMYGDTLPTSGNTEGQIFFKSIPNTALYPLRSDAPPATATVDECKAFAVQHPNQIFVWARWQAATYTPGGVSGCWVYTLYTTYTYESTTSYTVFIARNLSTGQEFLAKVDGSWVEH